MDEGESGARGDGQSDEIVQKHGGHLFLRFAFRACFARLVVARRSVFPPGPRGPVGVGFDGFQTVGAGFNAVIATAMASSDAVLMSCLS